jgi:hypothetical protein
MTYERKGDNLIMRARGLGKEETPTPKPLNTDLWTLNTELKHMPNVNEVDLYWNMHPLGSRYETPEYIEFANSLNIPTMMPQAYSKYPVTIEYPLNKIVNEFQSDYFAVAFAYMFPYAFLLGYKKIDTYGLNMKHSAELYKNLKGNIEYWTGVGQSRGIEINHHGKHTTLLKTFNRRIYGYVG